VRVAIAGAGMTGAFLSRLLGGEGHEIDVYGVEKGTTCGLRPCAWGTSRGFTDLVGEAGLDPERYVLRRLDHLMMDEVRVGAELMTFDKPRLVWDLLRGTEVRYSPLNAKKYDRVIDATGVARAFLPRIGGDVILPCVQYRVEAEEPLGNRIRLGGIGFAWCFPLSNDDYHVGCGSLIADPRETMEELGWIGGGPPRRRVICGCSGEIRITGPHGSQPFFVDDEPTEVWGVGEAIGCVAPLAGDGVVPGMKSVQVLMERWDDPEGYTRAILKEFGWMERERGVIDKLVRSESLGIRDAMVFRENSKRMGMRIGLREAATLMRRLR
jgi:flavin-dependent dehydrogenase